MKTSSHFAVLGLLVIAALGLLAACGPVDIEDYIPYDDFATLTAQAPTEVSFLDDSAEDADDGTPDATATPEVAEDANCQDCHSNQEVLEQLAVEEEAAGEALSSGEG